MNDGEIDKLSARLHRLNDTVQRHELTIAENAAVLAMVRESIRAMASGEALTAAMQNLNIKIESAGEVMSLKVNAIHEDLGVIKKAIAWGVGLVIGTVIVAVLALVFKKP